MDKMDALIYRCHFKEAIRLAMTLAQETNRYLDEKSPWKAIKTDKAGAGTSLYVAMCRAVLPEDSILSLPAVQFAESARIPRVQR